MFGLKQDDYFEEQTSLKQKTQDKGLKNPPSFLKNNAKYFKMQIKALYIQDSKN